MNQGSSPTRVNGLARPGRLIQATGLLALLMVLTHCGKVEEATGPASGTFGHVYKAIKSNNCDECHVPTGAATVNSNVQLDFTSQTTAYTTLMNTTVTGGASVGTCGAVKNVTASDPTKSYFAGIMVPAYRMDNFAGATGCLPVNTHIEQYSFSGDEQTSLTNWIKNGALNN
jgi:hypothetical protein